MTQKLIDLLTDEHEARMDKAQARHVAAKRRVSRKKYADL